MAFMMKSSLGTASHVGLAKSPRYFDGGPSVGTFHAWLSSTFTCSMKRCRMACRHIDESEVEQILQEGKINYTKSELDGADCKKKYAVEGLTRDKQKVRIIFAPCSDEVTVVTVIDIGKEWPCDCE